MMPALWIDLASTYQSSEIHRGIEFPLVISALAEGVP